MKNKNQNQTKKISLNKETITILNKEQLTKIYGGIIAGEDPKTSLLKTTSKQVI